MLSHPKRMALFLALMLAACASSAPQGKVSGPESLSEPDLSTPLIDGSLPAQYLNPGECGIFLWNRAADAHFIFFARAGEKTAMLKLQGEEVKLDLMDVDGRIFGQFLTIMNYNVDTDDRTVRLEIEPGEALINGQKITAGNLSIKDHVGWETIIPIVGVRACMSGN